MLDPEPLEKHPFAAFALFLAVAGTMTWDIIEDIAEGASLEHFIIEVAVVLLAMTGLIWSWIGWMGERKAGRAALARAEADGQRWHDEADSWRKEARQYLDGLSVAIDSQFERWKLTPAEREVAFLMLKGLSHREISEVRTTSEKTVRQQALAIYRKAGLGGRAELSAFFLEDLLLPVDPGEDA